MWNLQLPEAAVAALHRACGDCGPLASDPEPFLASVFSRIGCLPPDLTRALLQFRANPAAPGAMVIRGMPIERDLPPTPTADSGAPKATFVSEASVLLVALILGEPVAYLEEKNGALVQNVYPIEAEKRAPSNESSETELEFHTELSFSRHAPDRPLHVACPDFLLLFGLRAAPLADAVTTLVEARDVWVRLSARGRETLRQPLFELRAPYSFTQPNGIERRWSCAVPLFYGTDGAPTMAFDLACGVRGRSPAALEALDELRIVMTQPEVQSGVRLGAGDLLVVNNRKCAHARSRFEARFDGTDRWLQRVYVRRSLEGLERTDSPFFRVL